MSNVIAPITKTNTKVTDKPFKKKSVVSTCFTKKKKKN